MNIQVEDTDQQADESAGSVHTMSEGSDPNAIRVPGPTLAQTGKRLSSNTHASGETAAESESDMSPFEIMLQRWEAHQCNIPQVDKTDIHTDNPHFNGKEHVRNEEAVHQHAPEFTQMSYLRMRSYEEAMFFGDCYDPFCNLNYQKFVKDSGRADIVQVQNKARAQGIQKLFHLHEKKQYRLETLFTAASVFDRYLASVGHWTFPTEKIVTLATISMLLAAKLEQPVQPSFARMIIHLTEEEKKIVTKDELAKLEHDILTRLGFEFNFSGLMDFIQRYLRVLGWDKNPQMKVICEQLARFQLNYSTFLKFKPSQLAACIVIIAVNILRKTQIDSQKKAEAITNIVHFQNKHAMNFLKKCPTTGLYIMNTDIWNNPEVTRITGYTLEMIKEPLLTLCQHLQSEIRSSQLEDFNVDYIRSLRNYQDRIESL